MKYRTMTILGIAIALLPRLSPAQWTKTAGPNDGVSTDVYALAASGNEIFAGTINLYRSSNSGASWMTFIYGLPSQGGISSFAATDSDLWAGAWSISLGTGGGVFHANREHTLWSESNSGLPANVSANCLVVNGANLFVGVYPPGVYRTSTTTWTPWIAAGAGLPSTAYVQSLVAAGSDLFAGTDSGVYRSHDNGASWAAVNIGLPASRVSCRWLTAAARSWPVSAPQESTAPPTTALTGNRPIPDGRRMRREGLCRGRQPRGSRRRSRRVLLPQRWRKLDRL